MNNPPHPDTAISFENVTLGYDRHPAVHHLNGHIKSGTLLAVLALFARLIIQDAQILLLDEPFTAVDEATADDLMTLMHLWHKQGRTIVAVLHDLGLIRKEFPESLLLAREVIGWGSSETVLSDVNLQRARHMAEAHDPFAAACERIG